MRRPWLSLLAALVTVLVLALAAIWPSTGRTLMDRVGPTTNDRAARAEARVRPQLEQDLAELGLRYGAPVFMRIFKRERELELWLKAEDGIFKHFRTYPICTYSGSLGPKQRQGDNQAPEGFYRVTKGQLNPASRYHLSFNLGYPNAFDRAHGRDGDFLMVHGSCVSIGCYAMGDEAIEEIYSLAAAALQAGQPAFEVHAFPFRFVAGALDAERDSPWHTFWSELEPAYVEFEANHLPPRIVVDRKHYRVESNQ